MMQTKHDRKLKGSLVTLVVMDLKPDEQRNFVKLRKALSLRKQTSLNALILLLLSVGIKT